MLLSVKNLNVQFKVGEKETVQAVDNISFDIQKAEIFCLVGESGSGKSVTALSIAQLIQTSSDTKLQGEILWNSQNILQKSNIEKRSYLQNNIGMIFQNPMSSLNPVLTIGYQLLEAKKDKHKKAITKEKILEMLSFMKIPNPKRVLSQYPHELSGGMQQRVCIAMAMLKSPQLLIADEPTTSLDMQVQAQVITLIQQLRESYHTAILFITHNLPIVRSIADRVGVIHKGKIVEIGDKKQIFENPKHPYTKNLLRCVLSNKKNRKKKQKDTKTHIHLKNFCVHFPIKKNIFQRKKGGLRAVDNISIKINKGETFALIGESGSGKSTLAKSMLFLINNTSVKNNKISYYDKKQKEHTISYQQTKIIHNMRKKFQIIFQNPYTSLNPKMIVYDILQEGLLLHSKKKAQEKPNEIKKEIEKKLIRILDLVQMPKSSLFQYPHEFSGGQRQRICIARVLLLKPELIICDEITSSLDASVQVQVLDLLQDLQKEFTLTYFFITHDIDIVKYMSDRVAVMFAGKIVEQGETQNVLTNPKNDYTKQLMASQL